MYFSFVHATDFISDMASYEIKRMIQTTLLADTFQRSLLKYGPCRSSVTRL